MAGPGARLLNAVHAGAIAGRRISVLARHIAETIPGPGPGPGRVLDLGCGDGRLAARLMQLRPDLVCEGVDVLIRPVTAIPVTPYDGHTLPFPDDSFDYVTIIDVLHHADDAVAVLREAARVSRHGIVIKDHLREGFFAEATLRAMDWVGNAGHGVSLPYSYLDRKSWNAAFAEVELQVVQWHEKLDLYPLPLSWFFDRRLHFLAFLTPH